MEPTLVFLPGAWTEDPGGLQSVGSQKVRHDSVTNTTTIMWDLYLHYANSSMQHVGFFLVSCLGIELWSLHWERGV